MSSSPLSSLASSPLSSVGSRSPTPPGYLSPPSSGASDSGNVSHVRVAEDDQDREGPPPAKRRKIAVKEPRTTEYLDLHALNESSDETHHKIQDAKLKKLMEALRSKKKIVVIAGAGISVSAGIPDFRSSTGLFKTLRGEHKLKSSGKHLFDASVYRNDNDTKEFHSMVRKLSHMVKNAEPTPFHHMLATLAEEGRLMRLYTQNIDCIDTSIKPLATQVPLAKKGPWPRTVQLHGGLQKMVCTKCRDLKDFDGELFEGSEAPCCKECEDIDLVRTVSGMRSHGIGRLRPRIVLYNEYNPDEEAIGAVNAYDIKNRPDAVIVVGTSLKIPGIRRVVKEMCAVTRDRRGGFTAWINLDSEPSGVDLANCWDLVVKGECDDVARYVGLPHWDDKDCGEYKMVDGEKVDTKKIVAVVVDSKPAVAINNQGIPTPTDSPRQQSPTPMSSILKLKQPKLEHSNSFLAPTSKPEYTKDGKLKKKAGRKPLPTGKPNKDIAKAFPTTKKGTVKTPTKGNAMFPGLVKKAPTTPMRPVSPTDHRNNGDYDPKSSQPEVVIPVYCETITPPSKPSGMGDLIS
ncbi:DHS-like NAD/FAD-binding domain-containing protein [Halenospora varia]|nr:DHS-like NAD/FAD-binding domain-containing protein [Halenospora varia]